MEETIAAALRRGRRALQTADPEIAPRESSLLLGYLLGYSEAQILTRDDQRLPAKVARRFEDLIRRRCRGEPAAYLLGRKEFYGRKFLVDDRVLIPRPETEHLVEAVLTMPGLPENLRILDVGTGSGCLAVTLALEIPTARIIATDLSPAALALARGNAQLHGVEDRIHFAAADLLSPLDLSKIHLLVSNPPYVAKEDASTLPRDVRDFEPHLALFAPDNGLALLRRLLEEARGLARGARVLVEIGFGQLAAVKSFGREAGWQVIREIRDYGKIPRTVILARREENENKNEKKEH